METMIISQWSSTKATSRSAMTRAASQDMPSTGEASKHLNTRPTEDLCFHVSNWIKSLCSVASTETINDGQFHTVELVTFDQMVNLSIDGGLPTTMDSFGAVRPLNGEAPLYVGGRGPLQNTPPSSAGTLNYYTTVNHPPPPSLCRHCNQPLPPSCDPSPKPPPPSTPSLPSVSTVFARGHTPVRSSNAQNSHTC